MSWTERLPDLIGTIGNPDFPPALERALGDVAPFDITCAFAYPIGFSPILLRDGLGRVASRQAIDNYLKGSFLLDCVYTACKHEMPPGLYRLSELAPDAFFEGDYYNSPEVHPCISLESGSLAEEIVFLARLPVGFYAAYSLMRQNGRRPFDEHEMEALRMIEPQVRALIMRHWQDLPAGEATPSSGNLEAAFETFAPRELSERERMIVALVLQGHSSMSVGLRLGISPGTVKIHRKNIYAKLKISSQAELFAMFVRHIRR